MSKPFQTRISALDSSLVPFISYSWEVSDGGDPPNFTTYTTTDSDIVFIRAKLTTIYNQLTAGINEYYNGSHYVAGVGTLNYPKFTNQSLALVNMISAYKSIHENMTKFLNDCFSGDILEKFDSVISSFPYGLNIATTYMAFGGGTGGTGRVIAGTSAQNLATMNALIAEVNALELDSKMIYVQIAAVNPYPVSNSIITNLVQLSTFLDVLGFTTQNVSAGRTALLQAETPEQLLEYLKYKEYRGMTIAKTYLDWKYFDVTDSLTIETGLKTINISFKQIIIGNSITIQYDPSNKMIGTVVSYDNLSGALVANITSIEGSGTFSAWEVYHDHEMIMDNSVYLSILDEVDNISGNTTINTSDTPWNLKMTDKFLDTDGYISRSMTRYKL